MVFTNSCSLLIKVDPHVVDADSGQEAFLYFYLMNSADGS